MMHPKSVRHLEDNLEGIKHNIILLQLLLIFNLKGEKRSTVHQNQPFSCNKLQLVTAKTSIKTQVLQIYF